VEKEKHLSELSFPSKYFSSTSPGIRISLRKIFRQEKGAPKNKIATFDFVT
jgi:hypothetical protein